MRSLSRFHQVLPVLFPRPPFPGLAVPREALIFFFRLCSTSVSLDSVARLAPSPSSRASINARISASSGNPSWYFEMKSLLLIPARAYLTRAWFFSVQRRMPIGGLSPGLISCSRYQTHVRVELAQVLVGEPIAFELGDHVALEDAVIKDEVDEEMITTDQDTALPRFETESTTEFEQDFFQPIEEGALESGFIHHLLGMNTQELEHVGIADRQRRGRVLDLRIDQRGQLPLVTGEARALVVEAGDLPLEFPYRPRPSDGFDLVEGTFLGGVDCREQLEVAVRQCLDELLGRE